MERGERAGEERQSGEERVSACDENEQTEVEMDGGRTDRQMDGMTHANMHRPFVCPSVLFLVSVSLCLHPLSLFLFAHRPLSFYALPLLFFFLFFLLPPSSSSSLSPLLPLQLFSFLSSPVLTCPSTVSWLLSFCPYVVFLSILPSFRPSFLPTHHLFC